MKNIISAAPLKIALKADVFALKVSADAFVALLQRKELVRLVLRFACFKHLTPKQAPANMISKSNIGV